MSSVSWEPMVRESLHCLLILAGISDHDGGKMIVNGEQALISINTGSESCS